MKLPISKKFKLRNKRFVWIGRVRNVIKLNVLQVRCQDLKMMGVYWYTRKSHKLFKTDGKLKVAKQATRKTCFLPYLVKSSVLW